MGPCAVNHTFWTTRQRSGADSRLAPSQWETSLQSNAVSHWKGAYLESALMSMDIWWNRRTSTVYWCIASKLKVPLFFFNGMNKTFLWVNLSFFNQSYSGGITTTKKPATGYRRYYHSICRPPRCHAGCHGAWPPHHERWAYTSKFLKYISGF